MKRKNDMLKKSAPHLSEGLNRLTMAHQRIVG